MEILLQFLAISMGINLLMFLPAYLFKTDKLTDISYALTFVTLGGAAYLINPSIPGLVLSLMVLLWAIRLGTYLLIRIHKMGRDTRFDEMRSKFLNFLGFWLLQGFTVWVVMLPVLIFSGEMQWSSWSFIGMTIWGLGLWIETRADQQKFRFKCDPKNKGKWIDEGLWAHSRHPNYLGEILHWLGVYLTVVPGLVGLEQLLGALSPIYIASLLLFVSGVPLLEKSAEKKWGKDPEYKKYKKRTGVLLPKNLF